MPIAVVALACDPNIISRTGQILNVGNLSREYGFTDIDGTQPPLTKLNGQKNLKSVQKSTVLTLYRGFIFNEEDSIWNSQ